MSIYTPDKWVILELANRGGLSYRVLASWYGGYTGGDSWKLSSSIVALQDHGDRIETFGASGSSYICHRGAYGTSAYTEGIYRQLAEQATEEHKVRVLDEIEVDALKEKLHHV